ncbi:2,5-diamino-6-(ribosylamino)-4(3H)-pyrimidinone 5'-phosphate reductase [Halorhabdus sp. BNX81]|uniref:2,5-diamino-6-(ribosylamino)-4(3H)-pyrimidinone 5'-phosphate reductase n=1 Tax=Halorhabdus sp. BNX81 TaxID=2980181 RepID=UPI0023DD067E|nr:2,5-diamino-6-(ribosylamino)-4(3H)-pyrimidinone 5'-phosphate reductase [Halorhabdus sp. BNX81]WEL21109.1 2,5-diamino-6-(ribosylamino)-4(3H)-pyrimidinone 5'-phosphate reductase [Halorhabdus sp. BNX81]
MHVVVNAAMSADGKLSTHDREQVAISGETDFDRVDGLRADSDAVMVGVGTVLADDPSLTVDDPDRIAQRRDRGDPSQPARVVADSRARTPPDAQILDDEAETYLVVGERAATEKVERLESTGATVIHAGHDRADLSVGLGALESHGIDRLMVEGGGELIFSLFADDLVDELSVFVGPMLIGGRDAPTLADGDGFIEEFPALDLRDVEQMDGGVLLRWDVA